jgi:mannitol-1-phosphate 5-dehydrogenase
VFAFLRAAFIQESGGTMIRRYAGVHPLFTPAGYRAYADDFLARMTSPWLGDTVERVGRDVERKLGWDDRLVATIRAARQEGVVARRYAFGVAAALATLDHSILKKEIPLGERLTRLWKTASPGGSEQNAVIALVEEGAPRLRQWHASGFQNLENLFQLTT